MPELATSPHYFLHFLCIIPKYIPLQIALILFNTQVNVLFTDDDTSGHPPRSRLVAKRNLT